MGVVQITKACTLSCTYCFDVAHQKEAFSTGKWITITPDDFSLSMKALSSFFNKKDEKSICISWWEPTIHPRFKNFVKDVLNSWFKIYLLTNFTFWEKIRNFLYPHVMNGRIIVMTNINSPYENYAGLTKKLRETTKKNLEVLQSPNVRISVNVFDPEVDYDYVLEVLDEYPELDDMVRIGIENAILPKLQNTDTIVFEEPLWSKYKQLGQKVDDLVAKLHQKGKRIYLDCGSGFCIFQKETLDQIEKNNWHFNHCHVPNDEVQSDGSYSTCYALYKWWNENWEFKVWNTNLKQQRLYYILRSEFYKNHYLQLPKCQKCPLLTKWCVKFCLSNNIYYWNRVFSNGFNENDDFMNKYLEYKEKIYAYCEYLISNLKGRELSYFLENLDFQDHRIIVYWFFAKLLNGESKEELIKEFNSYMDNQITAKWIKLTERDFGLARLFDLITKELKKENFKY